MVTNSVWIFRRVDFFHHASIFSKIAPRDLQQEDTPLFFQQRVQMKTQRWENRSLFKKNYQENQFVKWTF